MSLEQIEKQARDLAQYAITNDSKWAADTILLLLPVVRAAIEWKRVADDPGASVWKYTMKLDEAIDTLHSHTKASR